MITAPYEAPAFYNGVFGSIGAQFLANIFSEKYSDLIENAYIISSDIKNDIVPTTELVQAVSKIYEDVQAESTQELIFNPSYLPSAKAELSKSIEYDDEGNISAIGGFSNPFITLTLKQRTASTELIFDGVVSYKPFDLPSLTEIISPNHGMLYS